MIKKSQTMKNCFTDEKNIFDEKLLKNKNSKKIIKILKIEKIKNFLKIKNVY